MQQHVLDVKALAKQTAALSDALKGQSPTSRLVFREALLAWERVYAFRVGPIVENSGLLRSRFWPTREPAMRALLASDSPLTAESIEELGVDVRGMYALEWLLFSQPAGSERARLLSQRLAENVQHYADDALQTLGDGTALTNSLNANAQETVSRLVNQMVATVETLASDRLAIVLEMHAHHDVRTSEVQGAPSGSSRELVLAQLRATERLYVGNRGPGLAALVVPVAPAIDERVRARFLKARTLVERLDGPIEAVVLRDRARVEAAFRALKELEVALKVDLASALGVTMTFTAGDGD